MALQIVKPVDSIGIDAEYWKIIETNINYLTKNSHVTMAGYISEQTRLDGKNPATSVAFDWAGDEFPFGLDVLSEEGENAVKVAYKKIKESKMEVKEITPESTDEEGVVTPAVTEEVETNEWSEAVDC